MSRNPIARDLRSPKYRPRLIKRKRPLLNRTKTLREARQEAVEARRPKGEDQ